MTTITKPPLLKLLLIHHLFLTGATLIACLVGSEYGQAVMLGGLLQSLPQAWFNFQAFRYTGARQLDRMVRAMYWGESGKIILTATLFVAALVVVKPPRVEVLFVTFAVMIVVHNALAARLVGASRQ